MKSLSNHVYDTVKKKGRKIKRHIYRFTIASIDFAFRHVRIYILRRKKKENKIHLNCIFNVSVYIFNNKFVNERKLFSRNRKEDRYMTSNGNCREKVLIFVIFVIIQF